MIVRPEILAPAGTPEAMRAAVENGADAIYFGLERWNARERAANFTVSGLPEVVAGLHERGVRAYVTFNTLIYESELDEAEHMLRAIAAAGTDAIIVQDLGTLSLARAVCPELELHASTQMTITDAASAELARSLGVTRGVVARELSTDEIAAITRSSPLELEVFVHGALCVSYSGQCFTSASWGGRSANRGECAQACRLPYDLIVDDETRDLGPIRYLLSPHDLAGHDAIPALVAAGVVSLKIEGRLKQPEYVAATTAIYRRAVDRALAGASDVVTPTERRTLQQVYSRGPSLGFLGGTNHQTVLTGTYPEHRGMHVGTVTAVHSRTNAVDIELTERLACGDGLLLAGAIHGVGEHGVGEHGGRVSRLEVDGAAVSEAAAGARATVTFEHRSLDVADVPARASVWRTSDPELQRQLRATYAGVAPLRHARLDLQVTGQIGLPLVVHARDDAGHTATAQSRSPLVAASGRPLDEAILRDKLGRLGGTAFELGGLDLDLAGSCHLPVSELNHVHRELVSAIVFQRRQAPARSQSVSGVAAALITRARTETQDDASSAAPTLPVMCRTDEHLAGALAAGATEVLLDFMELVGLGRAVKRARDAGVHVGIAPPRIQKPGEDKILEACLALRPDTLLIRSLGVLEVMSRRTPAERPLLRGDFSLNAANALGVATLLARGLATYVPAYDLPFAELERLLADTDPGRAEIVVHQHLPMFHTEYCVYARLLSTGTSFKDCGRPCEAHRVALRDRTGSEHPVLVDVGCRNTVFSAEANSVADDLPRLLQLGVRRFRVELLREDAAGAESLVRGYSAALSGQRDGAGVRREHGAVRRLGVLRVDPAAP